MDRNEQRKQQYRDYVEQVTPKHNLLKNMAGAFLTGGTICLLGQVILNFCKAQGLDPDVAGSWCSLLLVLGSVILTGFNLYPKIARFGGAGTLVPITGFANSIAAPAIEFRREGLVMGVGAKLFTVAGPVLVYGISASIAVGVIYWAIGGLGG